MDSSSPRPPISPQAVIPFGILAVSTSSIFIRFAQSYAPSLTIAAVRLTLASFVLAAVVALRHRPALRVLSRSDLMLAVLSGFFLAIHFASWITSLEYTSVASSVVFVSTAPLWVAILAPLTLREQLARSVWIGLSLALFGGVVVGLSDTCIWVNAALVCPPWNEFMAGKAFLGDVLALVGAWAGAGYLLIGRRLRTKISLIPYIFVVYGMAALILLAVMFAAGQTPWGYPRQTYLWLLLLALVPQLLGHSTFNWALRYLSATYVSITLLGEPIGSIILAYFLLAETPTVLMLFGAILILVGIVIASRSE
jgi:drug/metabolite transporter (DMT)-like permease